MEVLRLGCRRAGGFLSRDEKTPQTPGQRTAPTKATSLWALARSKAQLAWGTLGKLHFAIIKLGSWNSWDFGTVKQRFRKAFYFYFISSCLTDFWKELISQTEMVLGNELREPARQSQYPKGFPFIGILDQDALCEKCKGSSGEGCDWVQDLCKPCAYSGSRTHALVPDRLGLNPSTALE